MKFIKKNIFNALFIAVLLVIVFVPDAKAFLLKGLMEAGFYSPKVDVTKTEVVNLSGIRFKNAN